VKIKSYYSRTLLSVIKQPKKIPALLRLLAYKKNLTEKALLKANNVAALPQTIAIIPTLRCNLRCIQCGQWGKNGYLQYSDKYCNKDKELTAKQLKSFIKEVSRFKPYLYFTGGEPLLREDIFELIATASSAGLLSSLNTNCVLLKNNSDALVKSGLDFLFASLDGPKEINDNIRLGNNSSILAIEGIQAVLESRKKFKIKSPIIEIRTVVTSQNQHDLLNMANFVDKDLQADSFCILLPIFTTKKSAETTKQIYREKFGVQAKCWDGFVNDSHAHIDTSLLKEQINQIRKSNFNFKFRTHLPLGAEGFDYDLYFNHPEKIVGKIPLCPALYAFPALLPNGDVATCASIPDFIAGNILKEDFFSIWNNKKYKELREFTKSQFFPTCSRCSHLYAFSRGFK